MVIAAWDIKIVLLLVKVGGWGVGHLIITEGKLAISMKGICFTKNHKEHLCQKHVSHALAM